ncbi:MAG: glycosyl transferase [Formosa sp.]|nr:glycosyl transferase [Formosa sp.]
MLSILIPCFDYNAYPLVCEIDKQALILELKFEIICIDDGSFSLKNELNQKINSIPNAKFIESKKNLGRIKNRLLLAKASQYDCLIYIDVDTTPQNKNFLKNYIAYIGENYFVFGGRHFEESSNTKAGALRLKFAKNREVKKAIERTKNPYKFVCSSNFMAHKDALLSALNQIENSSYGNDYIFGAILKNQSTAIIHVDNPVVVNEAEDNEVFIEKTKNALTNLHENYKKNKIGKHSISILKSYKFLEFFYLTSIFLKITAFIKGNLEDNLKAKNPNLFLFDLFRLRYLCALSTD